MGVALLHLLLVIGQFIPVLFKLVLGVLDPLVLLLQIRYDGHFLRLELHVLLKRRLLEFGSGFAQSIFEVVDFELQGKVGLLNLVEFRFLIAQSHDISVIQYTVLPPGDFRHGCRAKHARCRRWSHWRSVDWRRRTSSVLVQHRAVDRQGMHITAIARAESSWCVWNTTVR